jgi:hypothetical protein
MQDRPTAEELLGAVQRFLDEEIVPNTEGQRRFLARVAANVVQMVGRELNREDVHFRKEWEGLDHLLGYEDPPYDRAARREAIGRRTTALCERVRAGDADAGTWREKVFTHIRQTVLDKLAVSDPRLAPGRKE